MKAEVLARYIEQLGIEVLAGVPDSALKEFCDYINSEESKFTHYAAHNEGAAVGIAAGIYLSTGKPVCIYMQNSGIGNAINPITSIANTEVYSIPMLLIVGYRGSSDSPDEPQHKFMGRITEPMLDCMEIEYAIIDKNTTEAELKTVFIKISNELQNKKQFALIVKRNTFNQHKSINYSNCYKLNREKTIERIIESAENSLIVSTTGKISREVYEQSNRILGYHKQCFLTVGGMGHASMIAFGIARSNPKKRVICLDGDGAVLMHMGSLAFIGQQGINNLIHICLNNGSHESVGGMPTASQDINLAEIAQKCGYSKTCVINTEDELKELMKSFNELESLTFIEIKVASTSRDSLGRPKESALVNANNFMNYLKEQT
jgi:phosphonopyruvate decarboxylase